MLKESCVKGIRRNFSILCLLIGGAHLDIFQSFQKRIGAVNMLPKMHRKLSNAYADTRQKHTLRMADGA